MSKNTITIGALVALLVAGGLYAYFGLNPRSVHRGEVPQSAEIPLREFDTWDAFLSSKEWQRSERREVVFIGIDGGAWNIIDPMIEEGILPTFERLKREGSYGVLQSVECYVSPPAWATMVTGCLPAKTGIYTFGHWDRDASQFLPLSSQDVMVPAVWDISALAGKRAAVTNVPLTYPVRDPNGIMVSGLMTPISIADRRAARLRFREYRPAGGAEDISDAPLLRAVLSESANRYGFILRDTRRDGRVQYDQVHLQIQSPRRRTGAEEGGPVYSFAVGEFSPWVKIDREHDGQIREAWCKVALYPMAESEQVYRVRFSHTLFSAGDTDVRFTYPDSVVDVLLNEFEYYFPSKFLDREIVPSFTEDATRFASFFYDYEDWDLFLYVFTETDNIQHLDGVTPITKQVYQTIDRFLGDLLERLPDEATLILASDHGFKGYTHSIDLNKVFEKMGLLTYADDKQIDHENTLVFHNLWCVYFNDRLLTNDELEKRGVPLISGVPPSESLTRHLETVCRGLSSGDGRLNLAIDFLKVDPNSIGYAPDLVVRGTYEDYLVEFWNLRRPRETWLRELRLDEKWNHTREGIYLVWGDGVKRGFAAPMSRIEDVAPTMLYLLDLPLATNMDGQVMAHVFDPQQVAQRPSFLVQHYDQMPRDVTVSDEQRESLEKKLKSLGYIR